MSPPSCHLLQEARLLLSRTLQAAHKQLNHYALVSQTMALMVPLQASVGCSGGEAGRQAGRQVARHDCKRVEWPVCLCLASPSQLSLNPTACSVLWGVPAGSNWRCSGCSELGAEQCHAVTITASGSGTSERWLGVLPEWVTLGVHRLARLTAAAGAPLSGRCRHGTVRALLQPAQVLVLSASVCALQAEVYRVWVGLHEQQPGATGASEAAKAAAAAAEHSKRVEGDVRAALRQQAHTQLSGWGLRHG